MNDDTTELKPFWQRHKWLVRPAALAVVIFSPIVIPVLLVIEHWDDVVGVYQECWRAMRTGK